MDARENLALSRSYSPACNASCPFWLFKPDEAPYQLKGSDLAAGVQVEVLASQLF